MAKQGRNDPCACGSGKKFKHCCLGKEDSTNYPFSSFSSSELLKVLALLLTQSRNHGKNIRIELSILETLRHFNSSTNKVNIADLRTALLKYCPPHPYEDPPEEFFTELLYWHTGNHLVFPGIAGNGVEIVQQLLNTIRLRSKFPKSFLEDVEPVINFLLNIHTRIALSLKYESRLFEDEHHEPLYIPSGTVIEKQVKLFSFPVDGMTGVLSQFGVPVATFNEFVFDRDPKKLEFDDRDDNPLFQRPFISSGNEYILVDPTAELFCLNDYVLSAARRHSCLEILLDTYRDTGMVELYPVFSGMQWKRVGFAFPDDDSLPKLSLLTELLFKVDVDRLVYVLMMTEIPASNVNLEEYIKNYSQELQKRVETIGAMIKNQFAGHQILLVHVMHKSRILSKVGLRLNLIANIDFHLFFSYEQLILLSRKWDFDSLTLWKYGKYLHEYENKNRFAPYNTHFSKMKWYMDQEESFYHSDKAEPSAYFFEFEIESEVRRSSILLLDKKAIPYWDNGVVNFVPCYRKEKHYPVYISQDINHGLLASCILEYECPIWCLSSRKNDFHGDVYINGVLYWLHEMFPFINQWMSQLGKTPVLIRMTFDDELYKLGVTLDNNELEDIKFGFKVDADNRIVNVFVPITIRRYLYSAGNRGEYLLMHFILDVIGDLQEMLHVGTRLQEEIKEEMFAKIMPDGPKKYINTLSDYRDLTLSNVDVHRPRTIPKADVSYVLQTQLEGLGKSIPEKITEPNSQTALLNDLVTYHYRKVKSMVAEYNGLQLLIFLMRRQEAVLQDHAFNQVNYPVKRACYGHYYDVFDEFYQQARDGNVTNLALRVLIEWITCWMPTGIKLPSNDDTDLLLAHASEVLNYGSLSDEIRYGLRKVEMGLLPSGRLGVDRTSDSDAYDTIANKIFGAEFDGYGEKFSEYYERSAQPVPDEEVGKYVDKVERVFREEWGIGIHDIFSLTYFPVRKLFDSGCSVITLSENELFEFLSDSKFSKGEIEAWLKVLRFIKRDDVLKVPPGFQKEEVYPWRYNRRISYLLKPLLPIERGKERCILLSARHLYKATENLVSIFHNGSLPLDVENKRIRALLAERNMMKGKEYRDEVVLWLIENTSLQVFRQEIKIKHKGFFNADSDRGDIDILAIDHHLKIIYSIECKNTSQSKIAYDFHLEILDYLGKGDKSGLIQKHVGRDQWLRDHFEHVCEKLDLKTSYRLQSLVISKYVLPTAFLRSMPVPIISFYDLKKSGLSFPAKSY